MSWHRPAERPIYLVLTECFGLPKLLAVASI
jgi:hypothetical protein